MATTSTATRTCPDCDGLGKLSIPGPDNGWGERSGKLVPCWVCHGTGKIPGCAPCKAFAEREVRLMGCDACEGLSVTEDGRPCPACEGHGTVEGAP